MTVSPVTEGGDALARARRENETLYAVIKTVSSSLALDRVLGGIVEIATDATGCHACFIYFVEGDRLVLRAASPRYSELVGKLELGARRGADRLGRAHQDARVHPRARARGPAHEVRARARRGALPVDGRRADPRARRRRDRRGRAAHGGAARVRRRRRSTSSSTRRRWWPGAIENAQLYEERAPARRRAHHAHPAEPVAGRGDAARGPLRRGHARGAPAARRRRLPDLAPRRRGRRADAGRRRPAGRLGRPGPGAPRCCST